MLLNYITDLPTKILLLLSVAASKTTENEKVKLEHGEEFIVSCAASMDYHYCKFRSPSGDNCDFYKDRNSGRILEEFCEDLKDRTVFSGSLKDFECALLVKGALKQDEGKWSCEIGTRRSSTERNSLTLPWALEGNINIEIKNSSTFQEISVDESFTGIIQANKTLLVICIVVFVIFLSILFCVVFLVGRSKLQKRNFITREKKISSNTEADIIKEENKLPPIPGDFAFIKRVLPHIIKFPTKE